MVGCTALPDYKVTVVWGSFRRRTNRFAAEVSIGGSVERVHVPSSGRMKELLVPGSRIGLLPASQPSRKTKYSAVFVEAGEGLVSIDSQLPNRLVEKWLWEGKLVEFRSLEQVIPEVRYGESRFDFLVATSGGRECLIEVKSVTLVDKGIALFPDAPTERGARHMRALARAETQGVSGCVIFVVQRGDAVCFRPNAEQDPMFTAALRSASMAGVQVCAYRCRVWQVREDEVAVALDRGIPVELDDCESSGEE